MPHKIEIAEETYDEHKNEFGRKVWGTLNLEHSLRSISKWEAKWHIPFLSSDKTPEQTLHYIKCMTINNVPDSVYDHLTPENVKEIEDYIADPHTATTFFDPEEEINKKTGGKKKEILTAEVIYYQMISFGIPMECQNWHIRQLMALLRVFSIKKAPNDKRRKTPGMKRAQLEARARLNAERKAALHTTG